MVSRFILILLCALSTATGARPAQRPEHLTHLHHHQPQEEADEPGKNLPGQAEAFGDQEVPLQPLTSPVLSSLQSPPVTVCSKQTLHSMERGSQFSPKLLKLECDNMPVPSDPSSNQWDGRSGPSTSMLRKICNSIRATSCPTDDAGGDRERGPPRYHVSCPSPHLSQPLGTPRDSEPWPNPPRSEKQRVGVGSRG